MCNILHICAMNEQFYKISQSLRQLREAKSLNQDHMAELLNVSQRTYNTLENNPAKINLEVLYKMAEVLHISPSQLLDLDIKQLFQNNNINGMSITGNAYSTDPALIKGMYDQQIGYMQEEIQFLRKQLDSKQ